MHNTLFAICSMQWHRDMRLILSLSNSLCLFLPCSLSLSGARCKVDRDCGSSMCCARHHGEQVCKRKLAPGEGCFVPDGGLAFSINQVCPCDEGLLCQGGGEPPRREWVFRARCLGLLFMMYVADISFFAVAERERSQNYMWCVGRYV